MSRPAFQAAPPNPAMILLILGLIAGAGAGLLFLVGATAMEMGGVAIMGGIAAAVIATILVVASGLVMLVTGAVRWLRLRSAPRRTR